MTLQNPSPILILSDNSHWTDLAYGHPAIQLGHAQWPLRCFLVSTETTHGNIMGGTPMPPTMWWLNGKPILKH
jgi:hypothetical protein